MESGSQSKLKFFGIDIFEVRFISEQRSIGAEGTIKVAMDPGAIFDKSNHRRFQIFMPVDVSLEGYFSIHLKSIGNFELGDDVSTESKHPLISLNATAIMFPYIRAFINTLTSNLGNVTGPVIIPPHFFSGTVKELTLPSTPSLETQK